MDRSILFPRARTTIIRRGRNERKKKEEEEKILAIRWKRGPGD